jgi:hypothetical protein
MPIDYKKYPSNWHEFSRFIRFERAENRCEKCFAENYQPHPITGSKVILTVAHLDALGDICECEKQTGAKCANRAHVAALCQGCHLIYDIERHKFNRRRNRAAAMGQQWFADWDSRFETKQESELPISKKL